MVSQHNEKTNTVTAVTSPEYSDDRSCLVSIVIPTRDRAAQLDRLLNSLSACTHEPLEIIVVDNGSSDGTGRVVAAHSRVRYVQLDQNLWSGGGRAEGARHAHGEWILFIDDDNVVPPDLVDRLLQGAAHDPTVGIIGPVTYWYNDPSRVWCAGGELTPLGLVRHRTELPPRSSGATSPVVEADYLPNCFMVRRTVFDEGTEFDVELFPHNWSEVDFCLRARQGGFRTVVAPNAIEWHDVGYRGPLTRTSVQSIEDQARARIAFRKRFCNSWTDWVAFVTIVFPLSSVAYLIQLVRSGQLRLGVAAYWRGTVTGVCRPVPPCQTPTRTR